MNIKKELINIENFEAIDAAFIKYLRINNGNTGKQLAHELNISKSYLYFVENGDKPLSVELLNKALAHYDVKYNPDIELYKKAYELTIKIYECIIFKNDELLSKYESEFYKKKDIFAHSRAFIFNDLIIAIINIIKNIKLSVDMLKNAKKYLPLYDSNISYIFGIIYCFANGINKNLKDSKKVIYDIYEKQPSHNVLPIIKGMFQYQLGRISCEEEHYLISLKHYQDAITLLQKNYCIERINQVNIEIANILFHLQLYNEAEEYYLKLVDEAKQYNFTKRITVCLNNLSYLYLIKKEYEKCEKYALMAKDSGSTYPDLNYYLAYCAYKTKSKEQAQSIVSKLLNSEENRYSTRMMKMIQGLINDNSTKIDTYFNRAKKSLIESGNNFEMKILYSMVISYYVKKDSKKCSKLFDEYFSLFH